MRTVKVLWVFYRKLMIPSFLLALILSLIGGGGKGHLLLDSLGRAYFLLALFFHYIIYELLYKEEYYFYHNLGLSRFHLWGFTGLSSALIAFIFIILWRNYR